MTLENYPVHSTVPAADLERAKAFYADKLGLEPKDEQPGGIWYEAGGIRFLLYPTPSAGTAQNTAIGFAVDDIEKVVAELKDRGVVFEEYDFPGLKTVDSIADTGPIRAAWFKDSEGNIIGVVQLPS
ncbi:MAG TPA: glyoxalase [Actinobacteria bacterium]|nr:glyoxalase [Actinomycetota bacterium]HCP61594.1 glyoxalase [Actinomycetota bacterium]